MKQKKLTKKDLHAVVYFYIAGVIFALLFAAQRSFNVLWNNDQPAPIKKVADKNGKEVDA
jgi:hypothetical protein